VSIGRIDIATSVMTMSSFRVAPRVGHLQRLQRIYGYLHRMNQAAVRIRTEEPDYSDLVVTEYSWAHTVYGNVKVPDDAPPPLGKRVILTHYVDANLFHNVLTGRSVSGILHLANKTPTDWFSKNQGTVETATYGSEGISARICVEQAMDHRTTFRYLGAPITTPSIMFGDNEAIVGSRVPTARLHKRHNALSFHRIREAIAANIVNFHHIGGKINPADILSKHWGYQQVWRQLRPLLFWSGDTAEIPISDLPLDDEGKQVTTEPTALNI
jgi:hypothetical protein